MSVASLARDELSDSSPRVRDLRAAALGLAAWAGGLVGLRGGELAVLLLLAAVPVAGLVLVRLGSADLRRAVATWLLVALAVGASALLRGAGVSGGLVADLAERRAAVDIELTITSDPRRLAHRHGESWLLRGRIRTVTTDAGAWAVGSPVLVLADDRWSSVPLGSRLRVAARLAPAEGDDMAALVTVRGPPDQLAPPSLLWRGASAVRAAVREAVEGGGMPQRALVPALVDGDDQELPPGVQEEFRTSGLTHLLAVSGTNLTLVVGFVLVLGRWCGVRGRWQYVLGALGIVGFLLLARTEPSVVRAAAMGTVALLGLGANGRDRGVRALGLAVLGLLLWDPWLATTVGFALSVLATAGILLLAPVWVRAMNAWLPRWVAEAVAVPAAAQLACTPVVAAISGEVSLVAVVANLLAAPLVAPATVLGLLGGLMCLVVPPLGRTLGEVATWAAYGIVAIADASAALSLPSVPWGTGAAAVAVLSSICVGLAVVLGPVLARPATGVAASGLLLVVVLVPLPNPGWPPAGWVMVACDVGQGDAVVLRAATGRAVVVDAGPDAARVDRCLDRLGVREVPLLVLTHFHADHVDGLAGVLDGRDVAAAEVSALPEPVERAAAVHRALDGRQRVPAYAATRVVGQLTLQVLGPLPGATHHGSAADEGSAPNNSSLVLLVEVRGLRLLLTGDVEPEGQRLLAQSLPGLRVDVLKVPHHGSRFQDTAFLTSLGARVAVVSVGEDNDYGHPAPEVLASLSASGARVWRTDRDGDVAVAWRDGQVTVHTR